MRREERYAAVVRVLWVTLGLNWAVSLAKLLCGHWTGHLSLQADGFHSLSDGFSNVIGLVGMRMSMKPPDEDHPYGHRKFELAVALGIAFSLFAVAWHIAGEAWKRWEGGDAPTFSLLPFAVLIGTMLVNAWVSHYEAREGERLGSAILASDSVHTRSDVFASSAVLVALAASGAGWRHVDLVAAFAIALLVAWQGYQMVAQTVSLISDHRVIDRREVERVVMAFPGVRACHRIRTRGIRDEVFLDLHLQVEPEMPLREAHDLSHRVESRLRDVFPGLHDVTIHIEPDGDPPDE